MESVSMDGVGTMGCANMGKRGNGNAVETDQGRTGLGVV